VLTSTDIFIGVNAVDYSGYPDCRPEFIEAFQLMANLATKMGVEGSRPITIHTPLIRLTKAEIIRRGLELGVDFTMTVTCYDPSPLGEACGTCDACLPRRRAFQENGLSSTGQSARFDWMGARACGWPLTTQRGFVSPSPGRGTQNVPVRALSVLPFPIGSDSNRTRDDSPMMIEFGTGRYYRSGTR
jgi:hypothetical protein